MAVGVKTNSANERVFQGDVIRDVELIDRVFENDGVVEFQRLIFPLCVVLTQDCDLEQDRRFRREAKVTQDKFLMSVLLAPLYNLEHVFAGSHLEQLGLKMESIPRNKTAGDWLKKNLRDRYHYLDFPASTGLVPSVIDFKHYFSAHVLDLESRKPTKYVCTLDDLHRQDVSARFASFLARVALPELDGSGLAANAHTATGASLPERR